MPSPRRQTTPGYPVRSRGRSGDRRPAHGGSVPSRAPSPSSLAHLRDKSCRRSRSTAPFPTQAETAGHSACPSLCPPRPRALFPHLQRVRAALRRARGLGGIRGLRGLCPGPRAGGSGRGRALRLPHRRLHRPAWLPRRGAPTTAPRRPVRAFWTSPSSPRSVPASHGNKRAAGRFRAQRDRHWINSPLQRPPPSPLREPLATTPSAAQRCTPSYRPKSWKLASGTALVLQTQWNYLTFNISGTPKCLLLCGPRTWLEWGRQESKKLQMPLF